MAVHLLLLHLLKQRCTGADGIEHGDVDNEHARRAAQPGQQLARPTCTANEKLQSLNSRASVRVGVQPDILHMKVSAYAADGTRMRRQTFAHARTQTQRRVQAKVLPSMAGTVIRFRGEATSNPGMSLIQSEMMALVRSDLGTHTQGCKVRVGVG